MNLLCNILKVIFLQIYQQFVLKGVIFWCNVAKQVSQKVLICFRAQASIVQSISIPNQQCYANGGR